MSQKKLNARDVVIEGKWRIRGDRSRTGAEFQTGASIAGPTRLAYGNGPTGRTCSAGRDAGESSKRR